MFFFGPFILTMILMEMVANALALYFLVYAILINWGTRELSIPWVNKIMLLGRLVEDKIPLKVTINNQTLKVGCFIVALALWIVFKAI